MSVLKQRWKGWNRRAIIALWVITLVGIVAALPLGAMRMSMEKSADTVEYVFDFRDIVEVSEYQSKPRLFLEQQLERLKAAGITTMSVYESSLRELMQAGRLVYYTEKEAALLQGKLPDERVNYTYILFSGEEEADRIGPIVREAFERHGVAYRDWSFGGKAGLVVEQPLAAAALKTMDFDPISIDMIRDAGFHVLARLSDRVVPYDSVYADRQLGRLKEYGVTRLLFDGAKAKGASDQGSQSSLDSFGELLNQYDIGLTTIENLRAPQQGLNKLAYITDYNVVRLYSLSPEESFTLTEEAIVDRFLLAAKDRNIRMFFLNTMLQSSFDTGMLNHSVDKLASAMSGENGAIQRLAEAGFPAGIAEPFKVERHSMEKPLRGLVALGAIALVALLVTAFIPGVAIPVFVIGLVGSAGLYVLNSSLLEQALALLAAVSGPTLALIWVMNRIYAKTTGERRLVGGEPWTVGGGAGSGGPEPDHASVQWVFPNVSVGRRLGFTAIGFISASIISLAAVPFVIGLLNNITYSLVLEQFRGVSMLHFAPLGLVAAYVLFYSGQGVQGVAGRIRRLMTQPITLLWVVGAAAIGAVGVYYLSRTGNAGSVSSIELVVRNLLESTFGVRPRFKEFMLGHPALLLGLFLALRYRAAWLLVIVGAFGQLTMVSSFTHIHTPVYISLVRTLLGLGVGLLFGAILIAAWVLLEGVWRKWVWSVIRKPSV